MQMQVEAERRKRAAILESEGQKESDINVAEGKRQARILASGKLSRNIWLFGSKLFKFNKLHEKINSFIIQRPNNKNR